MPHVFIRLFCLSALLLRVCAQIRIVSPNVLSHEFEANHGIVYGTTATFGAPYYGERVLGRLVYGESKLGLAHCTDEDYDLPQSPQEIPEALQSENLGKHGTYARRDLVNVVLVHRGQCTFVTKAKVAQAKNAHAVIVVDHLNKPTEEIQKIIMADDGYGFDVKIPSIMVSAQDGKKLENAVKEYGVVVELVWDIPRGEVVVVDFWMSSASDETNTFLTRFQEPAEVLRNLLQFSPHYHIFSLPSTVGKNAQLCIEGKEERYCAPDPDGDGPVTGADVAYEDLRQLCLWRETAKPAQAAVPPAADSTSVTAAYSKVFWDYVSRLHYECPVSGRQPEYRFGSVCNDRLLEGFGASLAKEVRSCMQTKLDEYLKHEIVDTAWSPEALRVNGWRYSGPLDPETVLKAICHGFVETPVECTKLLSGYGPTFFPSLGISFQTFMMATVLLVAFPICACQGYKQCLKISMRTSLRQEITREVETQMAEYAPLNHDWSRQTSARAPTLNF